MEKLKAVNLLFLVLFIAGCATNAQIYRKLRDEYYASHKVNNEIQESIEAGEVRKGMTPYEVALAGWLWTTSIDRPNYIDSDGTSVYSISNGQRTKYFRFRDNRLVDWWETGY